ncbi:MAG: methyltransferase domain-containing protein [Gammaproteobacteria bacterium]|nr:methyltransferase domain-containing protein [Gammaproteobacteria bacterium]
MPGNSRPVDSSQAAPHVRLCAVIARYRHGAYRRPIAAASRQVFERIEVLRRARNGPIVLDAGCGTGTSTQALARRYPDAFVVGIDRNRRRLRYGPYRDGVSGGDRGPVLACCDLADFWRLAAAAGWQLARHYLLYPNPWPKARHLKRRWHAHPVFPVAIALGGWLELHTNWAVFAAEFAQALLDSGVREPWIERLQGEPLSPFERKYRASGHALWRVSARLDAVPRAR